jgi:hypothetical protein
VSIRDTTTNEKIVDVWQPFDVTSCEGGKKGRNRVDVKEEEISFDCFGGKFLPFWDTPKQQTSSSDEEILIMIVDYNTKPS